MRCPLELSNLFWTTHFSSWIHVGFSDACQGVENNFKFVLRSFWSEMQCMVLCDTRHQLIVWYLHSIVNDVIFLLSEWKLDLDTLDMCSQHLKWANKWIALVKHWTNEFSRLNWNFEWRKQRHSLKSYEWTEEINK